MMHQEVARTTPGSGRADVLRLQALGAAGDLELHLLALGQGAEAIHVDGGVVDEHVLTAAINMDGFRTLAEGQKVEFEVGRGPKGLQAQNVRAA